MIRKLQTLFDRLCLDIDKLLDKPEELTPRMKERIRAVQLNLDFNQIVLYPHRVLTKHDRVITPYRIRYICDENNLDYRFQPRVAEIIEQLRPVFDKNKITLNRETGEFYHGDQPEKILGEIDTQTEALLYGAAFSRLVSEIYPVISTNNSTHLDSAQGTIQPVHAQHNNF